MAKILVMYLDEYGKPRAYAFGPEDRADDIFTRANIEARKYEKETGVNLSLEPEILTLEDTEQC